MTFKVRYLREDAVADDGTLVYLPSAGTSGSVASLVWVDRQGREEPTAVEARAFREFSLSPDGMRVAVRVEGSSDDDAVWILDFIRNTNTRLTFEDDPSNFPRGHLMASAWPLGLPWPGRPPTAPVWSNRSQRAHLEVRPETPFLTRPDEQFVGSGSDRHR